MTKSEVRNPKEIRMSEFELFGGQGFGFRISGFFRASDFGIRI